MGGPLRLICSSGRGLGIPISHRESFHRLTEVISCHRGVTHLHALEHYPGWRLQRILRDRGNQSVPLSLCSPSAVAAERKLQPQTSNRPIGKGGDEDMCTCTPKRDLQREKNGLGKVAFRSHSLPGEPPEKNFLWEVCGCQHSPPWSGSPANVMPP